MKSQQATVLDLGSTKVTCLAARPDGAGGIDVLAVETTPCKAMQRGSLADIDEASRAVDAILRRVAQAAGGDPSGGVVVSIGGPNIRGAIGQGMKPIVPRGRHITYQDVMEVINHSRSVLPPAEWEQIQALPREFRVDGARDVHNAVGRTGGKLEVETYVGTARVSEIQSLEKAISASGRKIEQFVPLPLASGLGVLSQEERDRGAVVVDIGGGLTSIAVFTRGSIAFSATLPVGSRHVTTDLSHLLKTTVEEAERLKTGYGSALARLVPERDSVDVLQVEQTVPRPMQRRVMCEIVESRMREIALLAAKELGQSGLAAPLPSEIVLTGGGSLIPGTEKLFEEAIPASKLRTAEPIPSPGIPTAPGLAAALGLARFAIECYDELSPASGGQNWRDRVRSLFSLVTGS